jgi:hypothetical protein
MSVRVIALALADSGRASTSPAVIAAIKRFIFPRQVLPASVLRFRFLSLRERIADTVHSRTYRQDEGLYDKIHNDVLLP